MLSKNKRKCVNTWCVDGWDTKYDRPCTKCFKHFKKTVKQVDKYHNNKQYRTKKHTNSNI